MPERHSTSLVARPDAPEIETCRLTIAYPGVCCVCEKPARYAVLIAYPLPAVTLMQEHLRCPECAASDRLDPNLQAMKDYHPRSEQRG